MKPYYEHAGITIYHGDCREILPQISAETVITDPVWPNSIFPKVIDPEQTPGPTSAPSAEERDQANRRRQSAALPVREEGQ